MSFGRWLLGIALLAVLVVVYWPVLHAGFCPWDDRLYTEDNPLVRDGLSVSGFWGAFTSTWENNWSPIFWIFLAAQVSLGGGVHPGVFHTTSVLLCLLNAGLLLLCLRKFGISFSAALTATALFCLHPLRVEAVAWISAQKHLLAAAWLLVSLIVYREAGTRNSWNLRIASLVAYAFSLMCSQIGVGLPVFLFFWEVYGPVLNRQSGGWIPAAKSSAPYLILALGAAATTLWVNWNPTAQAVPWFDHSLPHRVLQAFAALGWQGVAFFWPWHLAVFYPWPERAVFWYAAAGGLLVLAAGGIWWKCRDRGGMVSPGVAGFFACFLPVSGLLAIPILFTADRLSYVPALFLALAGGAALDAGVRRGFRFPLYICGAWAVALAPLTFRQATFWKTERSIVVRTLSEYPDSIPAQINDATLDGMEGRTELALERFRKIRAVEPLHEVVWANEMALLKKAGRADEAVKVGEQAAQTIPRSLSLRYQLGLDLAALGRPEEALVHFRKVRELSPNSVQPAFQCARVLTDLGEVKEALSLLKMLELSLRNDPQYWSLRAEAHDKNGDWESVRRARSAAEVLKSQATPASDR